MLQRESNIMYAHILRKTFPCTWKVPNHHCHSPPYSSKSNGSPLLTTKSLTPCPSKVKWFTPLNNIGKIQLNFLWTWIINDTKRVIWVWRDGLEHVMHVYIWHDMQWNLTVKLVFIYSLTLWGIVSLILYIKKMSTKSKNNCHLQTQHLVKD